MHNPRCVSIPARQCRRGAEGACVRCPDKPLTRSAVIRDWARLVMRGDATLAHVVDSPVRVVRVPAQVRDDVAAALTGERS